MSSSMMDSHWVRFRSSHFMFKLRTAAKFNFLTRLRNETSQSALGSRTQALMFKLYTCSDAFHEWNYCRRRSPLNLYNGWRRYLDARESPADIRIQFHPILILNKLCKYHKSVYDDNISTKIEHALTFLQPSRDNSLRTAGSQTLPLYVPIVVNLSRTAAPTLAGPNFCQQHISR